MRARGLVTIGVLAAAGLLAGSAPVGARPAAAHAVVARTSSETPSGRLDSERHVLGGAGTGAAGRSAPRAPGWSTEVAVAPGTQMVGLTWSGPPDALLEIRGSRADGPWTEWLHLDGETGSEGAVRPGAGPAWLGREGVDRVQVRLVSGTVSDVALEAMTWVARPTGRALTVDRPATAAGGPPIHTRASWAPGGWQHRPGCTPAPVAMDQLRFAVVHHTVNANSYAADDVPGILAGTYRFHTQGNGWCDVAYSFFVDRFGRAWEGRSGGLHAPVMGGHAKGFNTHSVGIALLGQHQPGASPAAAAPTGAALAAVRDLLAWKLAAHGVDPRATIPIRSLGSPRYPEGRTVALPTIQGHRDSGLTSCPGDLVYGLLPGLRGEVAQRIAATHQPSTWAPSATGPAFFGRLQSLAAGRPMPNGVAGWHTSLVTRGGWPRDALAAATVLSAATEARIGAADRLYGAAFGRRPDGPGLTFWVGERDRGMAVASMARRFTLTTEFRTRHDGLSDRAYVAELYRNVLGREPEASGWDYWEGRLDGGMSRHQMLASMSESSEHRVRTAVQTEITRGYFVTLRRVPSIGKRVEWAARYAAGEDGDDLVAYLVRSTDYAAGA